MRRAERAARALVVLCALAACALAACKGKGPAKASPPAVVTGKRPEGELGRVTLTAEAEQRIGLVVGEAALRPASRSRSVGGDVLPSSGRSILLVAPVAGRLAQAAGAPLAVGQAVRRGDPLLRLTPVAMADRDLTATAGRAVAIAASRLEAMELRLARAETLLKDGAGSARAVEEAKVERDTAKADLYAAKSRVAILASAPLDADVTVTLRAPEDSVVRAVSALPASMVPAGAPLVELVGTGALWLRVNVFVGDLRSIRRDAGVRVRPLTAPPSASDPEALPIAGPPTADPATASYDLYYALPKDAEFRPGERVAVTLPYGAEERALHVPESAMVRDVSGAAWVYASVGERAYERRRVEVASVGPEGARISRGLGEGARIVTTGAVELFGAELGVGK